MCHVAFNHKPFSKRVNDYERFISQYDLFVRSKLMLRGRLFEVNLNGFDQVYTVGIDAIHALAKPGAAIDDFMFSWLPIQAIFTKTNNSKWASGETRLKIKRWTVDLAKRMEDGAAATRTRSALLGEGGYIVSWLKKKSFSWREEIDYFVSEVFVSLICGRSLPRGPDFDKIIRDILGGIAANEAARHFSDQNEYEQIMRRANDAKERLKSFIFEKEGGAMAGWKEESGLTQEQIFGQILLILSVAAVPGLRCTLCNVIGKLSRYPRSTTRSKGRCRGQNICHVI